MPQIHVSLNRVGADQMYPIGFRKVKDPKVIGNEQHQVFSGIHGLGPDSGRELVLPFRADKKPSPGLTNIGRLEIGGGKGGVGCVPPQNRLKRCERLHKLRPLFEREKPSLLMPVKSVGVPPGQQKIERLAYPKSIFANLNKCLIPQVSHNFVHQAETNVWLAMDPHFPLDPRFARIFRGQQCPDNSRGFRCAEIGARAGQFVNGAVSLAFESQGTGNIEMNIASQVKPTPPVVFAGLGHFRRDVRRGKYQHWKCLRLAGYEPVRKQGRARIRFALDPEFNDFATRDGQSGTEIKTPIPQGWMALHNPTPQPGNASEEVAQLLSQCLLQGGA